MIRAEYICHMGSDDLVVDAARASFDKKAANYTPEQNTRLIHYLAKHQHWTPFAHPQITLLCVVPIFVARQEFKHQVGFVRNEASRRYVDDTPEFHIPDTWRCRPEGSVKQGSGTKPVTELDRLRYIPTSDGGFHRTQSIAITYEGFLGQARTLYEDMLAAGVAPEQARMVLPQSMLTSYYVTGSLSAFARAYKLRADGHAQQEIQVLAAQWDEIIRPLFPVSWAALTA